MISNDERPVSQSSRATTTTTTTTTTVPGDYTPSGPGTDDDPPAELPADNLSSLSRALKSRKAEYVRRQTIRIKVATWNVAARPGTENDVQQWFVRGKGVVRKLSGVGNQGKSQDNKEEESGETKPSRNDQADEQKENGDRDTVPFPPHNDNDGDEDTGPEGIGLYVLGLQEIVDLSPTETLKPYYDPGPANKWKKAVQEALPRGFQLVAESQLVGLLLLIYASPSVACNISSVSSTSVATGLLGYMGNKGAVATRLVLGQTTSLVLVNCHLAAGSDKSSLDRRNWDAGQIISRTKFDPVDIEHELVDDPTETIGKEDFAFWFGDLNYRLDHIADDDVRNVLHRHTLNSYDGTWEPQHKADGQDDGSHSPYPAVKGDQNQKQEQGPSNEGDESSEITPPVSDDDIDPHTDPNSLQTTISSLFPHDQLRIQQKHGKAFQDGWREGHISFLPTYKYDVGKVAVFDSSEKRRGPSWCDRILYRSRQDRLDYERQQKETEAARKRDEEMKARGLDKAAADDTVLFDYDPATDGADYDDEYDPDEADSAGTYSSEKETDSSDPLHLEYYESCQGILTSDHKPLKAVFTLTYDSVISELKARVHQEVVRELDKAENESRPSLTVVVDRPHDDPKDARGSTVGKDVDAVDFGDVAYDLPVSRSLAVANTSGVPATFSFAETPSFAEEHLRGIPSWLHIQVDRRIDTEDDEKRKQAPGEYTLFPGELANIDVIARVTDMNHVRLLNYGEIKLEEILVLRVAGGRDHFIPVHGRWLATCFGRSVDDLTHMPEAGARTLEPTTEAWGRQKHETAGRLSAPRELFRLTEAISELTERAVAEWSMTKGGSDEESSAPWVSEHHGTTWPFARETWVLQDCDERMPLLISVREALDTNKSLNNVFPPEVPSLHRLEILSETLLTFLHSLSDGIVTAAVWQKLEQELIAREKAKMPPRTWEETQAWVLENLAYSPAHSVSFTFVTFMLAHIANEVAPVSSIPQQPRPSSGRPSSERRREPPPQSPKEGGQQQQQQQNPPPSPASTAAFISAGSFRRRPRSGTSSTSSETPISSPNPAMLRRQAVENALASLFSRFLISSDVPVPSKDRERRTWEARERSIIEPFLKSFGVDSNGPSGGR